MHEKKEKQYEFLTEGSEVKQDKFEELHSDKVKQLERQVKKLESEKKEYVKQLEQIEFKKSGLSPEDLSKINILTTNKTVELRNRIKECDRVLKGQSEEEASGKYKGESGYKITTRYDLFQEQKAAQQQKNNLERTLASSSTRNLSANEKDYLSRRKKELEEILRKRTAAVGDEWKREDSYEFNKTVHNLVKFGEDCDGLIKELKNINKLLDPENPNAGDVGYLYKTRKRNS
jgi:hypothetical protein